MIGSISGDIIGSAFEAYAALKEKEKKRKPKVPVRKPKVPVGALFSDKSTFTDDTVLTVATADAILNGSDYSDYIYRYAKKYPDVGYGSMFKEAIASGQLKPYNSWGNGSAMRIGPIGWAFDTLEETLEEAKKNSECSHNHPEGIRGACAIAMAIYLARTGSNKEEIKKAVSEKYFYDFSKNTSDFPRGAFDITCEGTVIRCMAIFMEEEGLENLIRKTIRVGGDVDTNACIVGSICDAYYGMPSDDIIYNVYVRLPKDMAEIVTKFTQKYINKDFNPPKIGNADNSILNLEI